MKVLGPLLVVFVLFKEAELGPLCPVQSSLLVSRSGAKPCTKGSCKLNSRLRALLMRASLDDLTQSRRHAAEEDQSDKYLLDGAGLLLPHAEPKVQNSVCVCARAKPLKTKSHW